MPRSAPLFKDKSKWKLTRKQKAFADTLLRNPKMSATNAALQAYDTKKSTASSIAYENLNKPHVQMYLDAHIQKAKNKVVELIDSEKEDIALRASDSVLDRALGKATQRVETTGVSVNINLDLTTPTSEK